MTRTRIYYAVVYREFGDEAVDNVALKSVPTDARLALLAALTVTEKRRRTQAVVVVTV